MPLMDLLLWLLLPACGSVILLATTNQMCQNVAVVPFLWVLPLSLYLLTFVICFERDAWYVRRLFVPMLAATTALVAYLLWRLPTGDEIALPIQVAVYSSVLFVCCMTCHGELVKRRPATSRLTFFYLMVAAGGVLGSLFVNFVAPRIFPDYWEFQIGIIATHAIVGYCIISQRIGKLL